MLGICLLLPPLSNIKQTVDTDMVGAQGEAKGSHPSLTVRSAISVRIITPAIAKLMTKDSNALPAPAFNLPASAKLQQLHDNAVRHLSNNAPDWLDATSLLDLHMHELPIVSSCFDSTLDETGLAESLKDGVLTIYAVARPASTTRSAQPPGRVGKNDLYAAVLTGSPRFHNQIAVSPCSCLLSESSHMC